MSPGLQPRPSLSVGHVPQDVGQAAVSPGLQPRPSLSGAEQRGITAIPGGVAGVTAPALIERATVMRGPLGVGQVSPGLQPRPSLSGRQWTADVAGDHVSPGLQPRPSLSGVNGDPTGGGGQVSPGLQPRPSLSAGLDEWVRDRVVGCRRGYSPGPH